MCCDASVESHSTAANEWFINRYEPFIWVISIRILASEFVGFGGESPDQGLSHFVQCLAEVSQVFPVEGILGDGSDVHYPHPQRRTLESRVVHHVVRCGE